VTDKQTFLDLVRRLEEATGPDRELDWDIAQAFGEIPEHTVAATGVPHGWFGRPGEFALWKTRESDPHAGIDFWKPKAVTASIDAAMTLVPETHRPIMDCTFTRPEVRLFPWDEEQTKAGNFQAAKAATPALALAAAALRARAT
jgi:hypothetical protein